METEPNSIFFLALWFPDHLYPLKISSNSPSYHHVSSFPAVPARNPCSPRATCHSPRRNYILPNIAPIHHRTHRHAQVLVLVPRIFLLLSSPLVWFVLPAIILLDATCSTSIKNLTTKVLHTHPHTSCPHPENSHPVIQFCFVDEPSHWCQP